MAYSSFVGGPQSQPLTAEPAFERQAQSLGLTPAQWKDSPALRAWAHRHCDTNFIPEELLSAWKIHVDAMLMDERNTNRRAD